MTNRSYHGHVLHYSSDGTTVFAHSSAGQAQPGPGPAQKIYEKKGQYVSHGPLLGPIPPPYSRHHYIALHIPGGGVTVIVLASPKKCELY